MTCSSGRPASKRSICRSILATSARGSDAAALCGVTVTLRMGPERARRRQRLGREDIERRAGERSFVERRDDIGIDLRACRARH